MKKRKFTTGSREVTLFPADSEDRPLIVLNNYDDDGSAVMNAIRELGGADLNLLCISGLDWNHDLAPWPYTPDFGNEEAFTGGGDEYLALLLSEILPKAKEMISGTAPRTCIAGYSLAGLFALYTLYRCDAFDRAASMSGSLWFPGFKEYVHCQTLKKTPDKIYISLGDTEERTTNPVLRTVRDVTENICSHYRDLDIDVTWELNRGNHFKGISRRIAKGILSIL